MCLQSLSRPLPAGVQKPVTVPTMSTFPPAQRTESGVGCRRKLVTSIGWAFVDVSVSAETFMPICWSETSTRARAPLERRRTRRANVVCRCESGYCR